MQEILGQQANMMPKTICYASKMITCNLYMNLHDYKCKLRHYILYLYVCHHILSVYLSFHVILSYDIKIYHFMDNYV